MIQASMRFVNSDRTYDPRVSKADVRYDKMWKVRHLLDHMNVVSKELLSPGQFISADEMMILAKCMVRICSVCACVCSGCVSMCVCFRAASIGIKVRMKEKPIRYGIKTFAFCDPATGCVTLIFIVCYICWFQLPCVCVPVACV